MCRKKLNERFHEFISLFHRAVCEEDFKWNWHHLYYAKICEDVFKGKLKNVIVNSPPGSSHTTIFSVMFPLWCFVKRPDCKFVHISVSDVCTNNIFLRIKSIVDTLEFQSIYPDIALSQDPIDESLWLLEYKNKNVGRCKGIDVHKSATAVYTGNRNSTYFSGAIILDSPQKPSDIWIKKKKARLNSFLKSELIEIKENNDTPVIFVSPRHSEDDATFSMAGGLFLGESYKHIVIPAIIDREYVDKLPKKIKMACILQNPEYYKNEKFSYWAKYRSSEFLSEIKNSSMYIFNWQYMQGLY